jgi:type IV pilus assembly protein PilP
MMRSHLWSLCLILCCIMPIYGCSNDGKQALEVYAQEVKQRKPKAIAPLPEIKPIETFVYLPGARRDPFVPDAQAMPVEEEKPVESELAPDPNRRKEELENVPLDTLRMVGTLDQNGERWALIRTKESILYRVKVGNYLGLNNGQITQISDSEITLTEIVADAPGQWQERAAIIGLSQ